jgi:hypothetical protein
MTRDEFAGGLLTVIGGVVVPPCVRVRRLACAGMIDGAAGGCAGEEVKEGEPAAT